MAKSNVKSVTLNHYTKKFTFAKSNIVEKEGRLGVKTNSKAVLASVTDAIVKRWQEQSKDGIYFFNDRELARITVERA